MRLTLSSGQIRYAQVPYTDDPAQRKWRPVVVVGWSKFGRGQDQVVLVVPITSFEGAPKPRDGDIVIDWQAAGLRKPSWVRARRLWGADPKALSERASPGNVTDTELAQILLEIEALFAAGL